MGLEWAPNYPLAVASRINHEMDQLTNLDLSGERAPFPYNSNYLIEGPLRPWWRAALFLIPILVGSVWLAYEAIRVAWVTYQVDTLSIPDLQKALLLDPGNPYLVHRLGLVYSYDPANINLPEAVKYLRQGVELNPHRWDFWSDLGTACDFVGDTACSDEAFERARVLNPMMPALQWALANHYLLTDRQEKAFPYFRRLLGLDPQYLDATIRLCLRATQDPRAIYTEVIPHGKDASARFAFLMFLTSSADYESAMRIWGQMISGPDRSPSLSMVKPFLDFLLDHNQIQNAGTVWNDLQHAGVIPRGSNSQSANLLYDGSFEGPLLNTGFDWRTDDSPDLVFDFSDPSAYRGAKCLRIDFAVGRNADYDLLDQVVRIKPNTRYQLTAYVRSDNLTSDSGPRLRVVEMGCENCVARTSDPTVGTTPWHPIEVEFKTQPQTQAVRISFWRPQNQPYPSDITGTVWLDDVILRTVETPQPDVNQARTR
jgi:tetratricopeptide (TPR) repeat protein